ncbi:unnamed protein product, partial [Pelagomonas calceolata]
KLPLLSHRVGHEQPQPAHVLARLGIAPGNQIKRPPVGHVKDEGAPRMARVQALSQRLGAAVGGILRVRLQGRPHALDVGQSVDLARRHARLRFLARHWAPRERAPCGVDEGEDAALRRAVSSEFYEPQPVCEFLFEVCARRLVVQARGARQRRRGWCLCRHLIVLRQADLQERAGHGVAHDLCV